MRIRVQVGGWEQECCGAAIERGDRVQWDVFLPVHGDLDAGADVMESHHGGLANGRIVSGVAVDIEDVGAEGRPVPVTRVPSGRALRGFDEDDDGHLEPFHGGPASRSTTNEVVVTLEIPAGTLLPVARAVPD